MNLTELLSQNDHLTFMEPVDIILQKGHSSYQKYHLTKVTPTINGTSQKWHLTEKLGAMCESYTIFKNSLLKITQFSPWQITSVGILSKGMPFF